MCAEAILYRKVAIPDALISLDEARRPYGGDIRIGDLTGDGTVDFVAVKSIAQFKPCFIGAFTIEGRALWSVGEKHLRLPGRDGGLFTTQSPGRPGPVTIYDIDGDGRSEVIAFMIDPSAASTDEWRADDLDMVILDGSTGEAKKRAIDSSIREATAYSGGKRLHANYCHQRLLIANFRGTEHAQDILVKIGEDIFAFDDNLNLLWRYKNRWNVYPDHSAYIPAVGDLDGDGRDEVNGGNFVLDHDGTPLWECFMGRNLDSVLVEDWDGGKAAIVSAGGQVVDAGGEVLLKLGQDVVPHGQEIRCGVVREDSQGPDLVIRHDGHKPKLLIANHRGEVVERFEVDSSPNETGMELIRWNGDDRPHLIYSPTALYDGRGRRAVTFPGLPPPSGGRMGWYHCFPADVCGDEREEVVLYDPCSDAVYIYTPFPLDSGAYRGYRHTPRQYNARLMD